METPIDERSNFDEDYTQLLDRVPLLNSKEPTPWVRHLYNKDDVIEDVNEEELNQFERNAVWTLVPRPKSTNVIRTKWIYRNKSNEDGNIVMHKARLVAQGYSQIEGIDFKETFAPVARLEPIRLLLSISCVHKFKLHQMDVKSAFFNDFLQK
ncbi:hypothetical protein QYF36_002934 [Acer negundo]|nr:hypothetical protein QYF36_002934 [Acer negundo]